MAICKFGGGVAGIRGTLAGVVFSANGTGPYACAWRRGANPKSELQTQTRGRISNLGNEWAAMTPTLRADWQTFAESPPEVDENTLGEVILLSGWMWFVRVNLRRQSVGLVVTTTVPASGAVAAPATSTITATALPAGAVTIGWTAGDLGAGYSGLVYLGAHSTVGLLSKTSHLLQVWAVRQPAGTSADISAVVLERFGAVPAGWKFWSYLHRLRDDGVRSTATLGTCEVT